MFTGTDVRTYFSKPGFRRMFQAVKRKYQSLGRVGGKVQLRSLSPQEQEVLGGFFSRNLSGQSGLTIDLAETDRIIRESRFAMGLEELLNLYFQEELRSNRAVAMEQEEQWNCFFRELELLAQKEKTRAWLQAVRKGKEAGYRTFLSLYREDREEAARVLRICVLAMDNLPFAEGTRCRRPVFAARLTGDPHGLDRGTWLGRLLYLGILYALNIKDDDRRDREVPNASLFRAEKMREVFRRAGLEEDDLSSNVMAAGLLTEPDDVRAGLFYNARENRCPLILPLRFFEQETRWFPFKAVFVMENPAVLSALMDAIGAHGVPPLICTSGQPSVAALRLLDELAAAGTKIFYSGDFDGKGLEIGVNLWKRYRAAFVPWMFDSLAYGKAVKGVPLTREQRKRIGSLEVPWDRQLKQKMLERGYVVFQEVLVEEMVKYLETQGRTQNDYFS